MGNEKVRKWLERIEETFHGPNGIVGEQLLSFEDAEMQMGKFLVSRFGGFARLTDAFLSFYFETLQITTFREKSLWSHSSAMQVVIHRSTFHRFKSADVLFMRGYFSSSIGLLRAIFENASQLAALKVGIIRWKDILGKLDPEKVKTLPDEKINKLVEDDTRNTDKKVNAFIFGKESGLSTDTQRSLKSFRNGLHYAVHRARLDVFKYFAPLVTGKKGMTLYPEFNQDLAAMYINDSEFIAWLLLRTFPLLQVRDNEFPHEWFEKYHVLDESFKEMVAEYPNLLGRSIEELIAKKFDFGFFKKF